MNDKFKELSALAQEKLIDLATNEEYYSFSRMKFADLIVKECGVALSPMLRDMISRGKAYDLIKEHFGIE